MARKARNYSAEFQRRNKLAQERGFKSYGQQRRYVEYTGQRASDIVAPPELPYYTNPRFDFENYLEGDDENLDAFIRMGRARGMAENEAYDRYMRKGRGEHLSRGRLKDLEMTTFDIGEDETWYV